MKKKKKTLSQGEYDKAMRTPRVWRDPVCCSCTVLRDSPGDTAGPPCFLSCLFFSFFFPGPARVSLSLSPFPFSGSLFFVSFPLLYSKVSPECIFYIASTAWFCWNAGDI